MNERVSPPTGSNRIRTGLAITLLGLVVYVLGVDPGLIGADRSPVIGFVQIAVFLVGLALICLGGYISLAALWNGGPKSIASDIGLRLVATGYVIAATSGMADIFGFGSQTLPDIPDFGAWQTTGVLIGEMVITLGFLLLIPFRLPASQDPSRP